MRRIIALAALTLPAVAGCGGGTGAAPAATVTVTAPVDSATAPPLDGASQSTSSPTPTEGSITTSRSHTFPAGRRADLVDVVRTPRSAYPTDTQPPGTTVLTVRVRYTQVSGSPTGNDFFAPLLSGAGRLQADDQQVVGGAGVERWQSTDPNRLAVGDPYVHSSTFDVPTARLDKLSLSVPSGIGSSTMDNWIFTDVQTALH